MQQDALPDVRRRVVLCLQEIDHGQGALPPFLFLRLQREPPGPHHAAGRHGAGAVPPLREVLALARRRRAARVGGYEEAVLCLRRELILFLNFTFGYTSTFGDEARDVLRRLGRVRERREVAALVEY